MDQVFLGRRNGPGRDRVGWCERMLTFPLSQRNLPSRGFSPAALLIGAGAVMAYGWYKLAVGIREQKYVSVRTVHRGIGSTILTIHSTVSSAARRCGLAST